VIHPCLTAFGGAELVALYVIRLLLDEGWDVTLLSDGWDPGEAYRRFGLKFDEGVAWIPYCRRRSPPIPFLSVYQALILDLVRYSRAPRPSADLVFDTYNGEGYLVKAEEKGRIIYLNEVPKYVFEADEGWRRLYYAAPRAWWRRFREVLLGSTLICNSSYTLESLKETYGVEGSVVYPPAQVEEFLPLASSEPRDPLVVTLSRFAPEKRLDTALRAFSAVVRDYPEARLIMIGSTGDPSSASTVRELNSLISALKLEENVQLILDPPLQTVKAILGRAKAIVSTKPNESFGIAILQGMASGCIPIVHRSGGQYMDVTDRDRAGLSYEGVEGLSEQIMKVLESESFRKGMKPKVVERARWFGTDRFVEAIRELIEKYE
jgi:glycosyltransferase involved in cell wall biosynthesis